MTNIPEYLRQAKGLIEYLEWQGERYLTWGYCMLLTVFIWFTLRAYTFGEHYGEPGKQRERRRAINSWIDQRNGYAIRYSLKGFDDLPTY